MQRLRRRQRLLNAGDYRRVFADTQMKAGHKALFALARHNDCSHHRLGLAIAKKHAPLAVQRNLIKRLAREHFRRLPETTAQDALDIVILTRPAARDSSRQDLSAALVRLFQKLGLENTAG